MTICHIPQAEHEWTICQRHIVKLNACLSVSIDGVNSVKGCTLLRLLPNFCARTLRESHTEGVVRVVLVWLLSAGDAEYQQVRTLVC